MKLSGVFILVPKLPLQRDGGRVHARLPDPRHPQLHVRGHGAGRLPHRRGEHGRAQRGPGPGAAVPLRGRAPRLPRHQGQCVQEVRRAAGLSDNLAAACEGRHVSNV